MANMASPSRNHEYFPTRRQWEWSETGNLDIFLDDVMLWPCTDWKQIYQDISVVYLVKNIVKIVLSTLTYINQLFLWHFASIQWSLHVLMLSAGTLLTPSSHHLMLETNLIFYDKFVTTTHIQGVSWLFLCIYLGRIANYEVITPPNQFLLKSKVRVDCNHQ